MLPIIEEVLSTLALIAQVLPSGSAIDNVIALLTKLIALGTTEVVAIMPMIKNIIAALQANASVTADQMTQLQALDVQTDADFDAAAKADGIS